MATAPECYACRREDHYVECVSEVEVVAESFDVVDSDWVPLGLAGG